MNCYVWWETVSNPPDHLVSSAILCIYKMSWSWDSLLIYIEHSAYVVFQIFDTQSPRVFLHSLCTDLSGMYYIYWEKWRLSFLILCDQLPLLIRTMVFESLRTSPWIGIDEQNIIFGDMNVPWFMASLFIHHHLLEHQIYIAAHQVWIHVGVEILTHLPFIIITKEI